MRGPERFLSQVCISNHIFILILINSWVKSIRSFWKRSICSPGVLCSCLSWQASPLQSLAYTRWDQAGRAKACPPRLKPLAVLRWDTSLQGPRWLPSWMYLSALKVSITKHCQACLRGGCRDAWLRSQARELLTPRKDSESDLRARLHTTFPRCTENSSIFLPGQTKSSWNAMSSLRQEAISHEFKYLPLVIFGELQTSTWPDSRAPSFWGTAHQCSPSPGGTKGSALVFRKGRGRRGSEAAPRHHFWKRKLLALLGLVLAGSRLCAGCLGHGLPHVPRHSPVLPGLLPGSPAAGLGSQLRGATLRTVHSARAQITLETEATEET